MDLLNSNAILTFFISVTLVTGLFLFLTWSMLKMVTWGKGMSKGAYLFLAFFPLISLMPIPPPTYENVQKAKQEQRKRKEDSGDPPDDEDELAD
jgi:multisubunit Na+/H+ antiporter MnhC subunit